jgi:hypothetical protein
MSAFPLRLVFPEPSPSLCVTFFSCAGASHAGTTDLQHTYPAAVRYLDAQPASPHGRLAYELVWVDNGGSAEDHAAFLRHGAQFEVARHTPTNEGLFRAVNDVWFRGRGCRAPYVLSLEDDRVPRTRRDGGRALRLRAHRPPLPRRIERPPRPQHTDDRRRRSARAPLVQGPI